MQRLLALTLVLIFCAAAFSVVFAERAEITYTLTLTDNGDGTYTLVGTVPSGVSTGKIAVSVRDSLVLREGSLTSPIGGVTNENYNKNGVTGAYVVFTLLSALPENTVVFTAVYEGAYTNADDITVPLWELGDIASVFASDADGDIAFAFVPFTGEGSEDVSSTSSDESSEQSNEQSGEETSQPPAEAPVYLITVTDNGEGTYTVRGTVSGGVNSGKIVIAVSDDLTLISGSLKGPMGSIANESYNRGGVQGACITFSTAMFFVEGTVVFTATYRAADGAVIGTEDVEAVEWNLGINGEKVSSNLTHAARYEYVPHEHSCSWVQEVEGHYKECACGHTEAEGSHAYDGRTDKECNDCGYSRVVIGDVNLDGAVDNLDAAAILSHDCMLTLLEGDSLAAGDMNGDGEANNLDAVRVLWYDAGIIE